MRAVFTLALLTLLAACTPAPPPPAPSPAPAAPPANFHATLASLFRDLATRFADENDANSHERFAAMAAAADAKEDMFPTVPDDKNGAAEKSLLESRSELVKAITPEEATQQPELAGQAFAYYECWLDETLPQAKTIQSFDCRDAFSRALAGLESFPAEAKPVILPPEKPVKDSAGNTGGEPPITVTYLVYFDWASDKLNRDALQVLELVLTDIHNIENYDIVVNGHADATGSQEINMALSLRRANNVAGYLKEQGIPEKLIQTYAFGETDPKVAAPKGTPERKNRRVEVVIE